MLDIVSVDLAERTYPIYIGKGLLASNDLLKKHIHGNQVLIVSNDVVAPLYLQQVVKQLDGIQCDTVILPDGEQHKTLATLEAIYDALLQKGHNRSTTLIALGGGVVGDITGFAAATYQRGVNFIQIPTTLLSQVDSSVGGKTGVNHPLGKNMIGAFHQPQCVLIDLDTLTSLPKRELSAGLAEVIKYGLIDDRDFFVWLENNIDTLLLHDEAALRYAIKHSCQNKARIVSADEKENGARALLNLGHTFGHAIEAQQGYGQYLHGEAVAIGMFMAADLSWRMGWISLSDAEAVGRVLQRADLPIFPPKSMSAEDFLVAMARDKKTLNKKLRLVLLKSLGQAVVTDQFDDHLLDRTLRAGKALCCE
ncbi:MAG TPA: 3-dehydroquinate synthase [Pseudomonadales bacterium]|nr:3-dehydroquinate synthase [Pseudomonadales bacterium]